MSADTTPTPLSQQAAPVPPVTLDSRVTALEADVKSLKETDGRHDAADARHDARLSTLESGFARVEQKVDALTAIAGEIKGLLQSPRARWVVLALAGAAYAYAKTHNIKIPFLED